MSDAINPSHYKHLPVEAIDIIMAAIAKAPSNEAAYLHGQVLKYLLRCWEKKGIEDLRKAKWYLDRLVASFDDLLAEINAPISEGASEETDQDDHPDRFQVGDTVVSWQGREGVVEAINLIEDFPITVRHSVREQVSYKLGGVKKKGGDHTRAKPQPDPPKPSRTQPPSGYRMLGDAKSEPRIEGDSYWSVGAKGWFPLVEELVRFANLENWAACRKIEEPSEDRIPHGWRKMEIGEDIDQDDKFWGFGRWVSFEKDNPPIPRGKLTDRHLTHIRWIEESSNNPTANPIGMEPPTGYRWLKFAEKLVDGDSWVKSSGKIQPIDEGTVNKFVAIDKFFIRKVEEPQPKQPWTPKIGERVVLKATGAIYRVGSYNDNSKQYSMEGWPGSCVNLENIAPWFENEEQPQRYREPTLADLANGPIECEVRDLDGEPWKAGLLSGICDSASLRFEGKTKVGIQERWEQCRIEVQE